MINFKEIWKVFSTGHGTVLGIDAISLSAIFRIAEHELRGNFQEATDMLHGFLTHEPVVLRYEVTPKELDELIQEIERNTRFEGTVVYNADGRRRYEDLPVVGFMLTANGFQTVTLSDFNNQ
ncbi:MAG: hypothetical protein HY226_03450 [Candidatus Vogelbacteria bacterium]|nr:hypothetical protein [Candidatus Vogelbacteria bacterium]